MKGWLVVGRSKYHAVRTTVDGITFASKKEARRYSELRLLEKAQQIRDLIIQPRFQLFGRTSSGDASPIGHYVADFSYFDLTLQKTIVEDVKSAPTRTPVYRLKKKLAEACHGITITEV